MKKKEIKKEVYELLKKNSYRIDAKKLALFWKRFALIDYRLDKRIIQEQLKIQIENYKILKKEIENEIEKKSNKKDVENLKSKIKEIEEIYYKNQDKFFIYEINPLYIESNKKYIERHFNTKDIKNVIKLKEYLDFLEEHVLDYLKNIEEKNNHRKIVKMKYEKMMTKLMPYITTNDLEEIEYYYYKVMQELKGEGNLYNLLNNIYKQRKYYDEEDYKAKIDEINEELKEIALMNNEEYIECKNYSKETLLFLNKYKNNIKTRY